MAKEPTTDDVLRTLRAAPPRIVEAAAGETPAALRAQPEPGEWSANEVLAHIRSCADVWGDCIQTILDEDEPTIRALSPRTWIDSTDYVAQDFGRSLDAFTAQRDALLAVLGELTPAHWERRATVTGAGSPLVKTVYDYAERLARHERPHLGQIERAVSGRRGRRET